jgi:predicted Zn finger-like uncharacterized protein
MSLATRCTSCGTVFRVVQDQLKVSEGWVRCGRCQEVFNAVEGLFDLDREPPPTWPQPAQPETPDRSPFFAAAPAAPASAGSHGVAERPMLHTDDSVLPEDFQDARFPSELSREAADDEERSRPPAASAPDAEETGGTQPPENAPEPSPQFLRIAEQAQRWERPRARVSLAVASVLLAALLAGQAAIHFRADVAAQWPAARPALAAWCGLSGCTVEAPLRLEALSVDSSGLVKLESEGLYRLEIVLRNRADHEVRAPSVDLSLTDPSGRLVARKAMSPAEFNAPRAAIPASGELPLRALLSSRDARIAGYTIDLFYP